MNAAVFSQQLVNALALGSVYAMIAVGLAMIYGVLRILHIAHAAVYTAGAYLGLYLYNLTGNIFVSVIGAMVGGGVIGAGIERFIYRPMLPKPRIVALIASIGIFICLSDLFRILGGPYQLAFNMPALSGEVSIVGLTAPRVNVAIIAGTALMFFVLWYIMKRTSIGLAIGAVAQDMEAAKIIGIDVNRCVQTVFFISSAMAAFGAIMVAILYNAVYTNMGDMIGYKGLALIVIGGFGSLTGAVVAAFLLGTAETFLTTYSDIPLSRDGIAMFMLVVLILLRPQGLLGKKQP